MTTTPRTDDTTRIPWAQTETMPAQPMPTQSTPYAARPASPTTAPSDATAQLQGSTGGPTTAPTTAPALNPPTWTGRKTAIAAALAIGISSMGAVAAAAALPAGTSQGGGQVQQGGFGRGGQLPGAGTGQQGGFGPQGGTTQQGQSGGAGTMQQAPGGTSQLPGTQLQQAPADPNASTT
jgi:hypothetical protein